MFGGKTVRVRLSLNAQLVEERLEIVVRDISLAGFPLPNAWIGGILCVRVMGLVDEWNHPALFDYMDRFTRIEPPGWTREWLPWTGRMWDRYRPLY